MAPRQPWRGFPSLIPMEVLSDESGCSCMRNINSIAHGHESGSDFPSHRHGDGDGPKAVAWLRPALFACSGATMALSLLSWLLGHAEHADALGMLAGALGIVLMLPEVMGDIRKRRFSMGTLTVVATISGILVGEPMEAGMVIFLYEVGERLEDWARARASDALSEMEALMPSKAHVVMHDGEVIDMPTSELEVGEVIRVLAGERVPVDGTIVRGSSEFDESHVTGESAPVAHGASGHPEVTGGSLNISGVIEMKVDVPASESTVSRIADMTRSAREGRVPRQSFLDAFAERYTPAIGVLALLVALGIPAAGTLLGVSPDWLGWARRGVALLVIGCPCSVVIGIPITFVAGIHALARRGIVIRGAEVMSGAAEVRRVMLDKTGTITTGRMSVELEAICDMGRRMEVMSVIHALESASHHPIAQTLVAYASSQTAGQQMDVAVWDVREIVGKGMAGMVDGHDAFVGKVMEMAPGTDAPSADGNDAGDGEPTPSDITQALAEVADEMSSNGLTPIMVSIDGHGVAVLGLGNEIRERARDSVSRMADLTGESPMMLTGDSLPVAQAIAGEIGVGPDCVMAGMSPEQKMEAVLSSQAEGKVTMMVGDGINDAPALAYADVGVAVGSSRADVSLGAADAVTMGNPLDAACVLIASSRRVIATARACLALALIAKVLTAALVMTGVMGMGLAVFADTGMTLIVSLVGLGVAKLDPDGRLPSQNRPHKLR